MKIILHPPLLVSGIGQRATNEDFHYPAVPAPAGHRPFFIVCDGMGGAQRGEVASRMATEGFVRFFESHPVDLPTPDYLSRALAAVELTFDEYLQEHPAAMGMGTTFTQVWFHREGVTLGHIGDSRIYRFRAGVAEVLTEDHSFVGELLAAGLITPEEAEHHPRKNVITRAIQGRLRGSTRMTVTQINRVLPGDVFLLCTDGVLEACPTRVLQELAREHARPADLAAAIAGRCAESSRDNYTALLVEVAEVAAAAPPAPSRRPVSPAAVGKTGLAASLAIAVLLPAAWWLRLSSPPAPPTSGIPPAQVVPPRPPARLPAAAPSPVPMPPDSPAAAAPFPDTMPSLPTAPPVPFRDSAALLFGYRDPDGPVLIPARFAAAAPFSEDLARVMDPESKHFGFIDRTGQYVIPPRYQTATDFQGGTAIVTEPRGGATYRIDTQGQAVDAAHPTQQP